MQRQRLTVIGLLVLQIIAIAAFPPSLYQHEPQSVVLPPAFFILLVLSVLGMNTGVLSPMAGRVSLVFVQGINIVVRIMILFSNLRTPRGDWDWLLIGAVLIGIFFSWFSINQMEKRPPRFLLLRQKVSG